MDNKELLKLIETTLNKSSLSLSKEKTKKERYNLTNRSTESLYLKQDLISDTYLEVYEWLQNNEYSENSLKEKIYSTLIKYSFKMYRNPKNSVHLAAHLPTECYNEETKERSNRNVETALIEASKERLNKLIDLHSI